MNEQPFVLDEDSIRAKAYELWQSRGGSLDDPTPYWYEAKGMLEEELATKTQEMIEAERAKLETMIAQSKETRNKTMSMYSNLMQFPEKVSDFQKEAFSAAMKFPEKVSDFQKEAFTTSMATLAKTQNYNVSNARKNFQKTWKFQETLVFNSLELQAQLTRMYVEVQKQLWQDYFKTLRKWF